MTKRVTYDRVEAQTVKQVRKGHDLKLYFRYTGMLHVFHDGDEVLVDGPRDYSTALAMIKSIGMNAKPSKEPNDTVTDVEVRRGKKVRTKTAVAAKVKAKKKGAKK